MFCYISCCILFPQKVKTTEQRLQDQDSVMVSLKEELEKLRKAANTTKEVCWQHDVVMTWTHFLCYWSLCAVSSPMDSQHKWSVMQSLNGFLIVSLNKLLIRQWRCRSFMKPILMAWCKTAVTPLPTHWSYCRLALLSNLYDVTVMCISITVG